MMLVTILGLIFAVRGEICFIILGRLTALCLSCEPASHGEQTSGTPVAPRCGMAPQPACRRPKPLPEALQRRANIRRLVSSWRKFGGGSPHCGVPTFALIEHLANAANALDQVRAATEP